MRIALCLAVGLACACADEREDRSRLMAIQGAYSEAIADDFERALHSERVTTLLQALERFDGVEAVRQEAADLAARIRQARQRNPLPDEAEEEGSVFDGVTEVIPEAASRDSAESIWMKALRVGAFRADFERYWMGCFQPVQGNPDVWRPLDVPPCQRRPGMDRIGEVRFTSGQISALVPLKELLKETAEENQGAAP